MWQEMIIIIIAFVVFGFVGYKIYCFFTKPISPCDHCTGCVLKEQLKEKSRDCKDFKREENKID